MLFLPLVVLAIPILDTSFVVARRLKHGQPISAADRSHLHLRFLDIGFSQRRAAVTMWAWAASLGAAALAIEGSPKHREEVGVAGILLQCRSRRPFGHRGVARAQRRDGGLEGSFGAVDVASHRRSILSHPP